MSKRAHEALRAGFADGWADPHQIHGESRRAGQLLSGSIAAIAVVLGATPERVTLTPSLTLAFDRVIGGMHRARRGRDRIIISAIERDAVEYAARYCAGEDNVTVIPVDHYGRLDLDALARELDVPDVSLVCVQHANQEIGTIQDIDAVADVCAVARVPLVVDATASIGHVAPPARFDALIANPADWGGPFGMGVVALGTKTRLLPVWPAGEDLDAGGVASGLALCAAVALQEREENRDATGQRLARLVDVVRERAALIEGVDVVGHPDARLPHVVTFSCLYADGEALVTRLDAAGFAIGSGSACASGTLEPSRVLAAIGALTHGNVRVALHPGLVDADIDAFVAEVGIVVTDMRATSGLTAL